MRLAGLKIWKRVSRSFGLVFLVGCVQVPHPFEANHIKGGRGLAAPPPSRLIIPPSSESLLGDRESMQFAEAMAKAMLEQTVPAVARPAQKGDWLLMTRIQSDGKTVTPNFTIVAPSGKIEATRSGMPVSVREWASAQPSVFHAVAEQSAPVINQVLTGLQARLMDADPHSLKHRAAKVYFKGVFGAPGDGNQAIAQQFTISFADKFNMVQFKPDHADYVVECHVNVSDGAKGMHGNPVQHVEIVWRVLDDKGKEAGKVAQINDVPAHSLDKYWGDIASAVGEEAAGGIKQVISNYSGRANKPLPSGNSSQSVSSPSRELQKVNNQHK